MRRPVEFRLVATALSVAFALLLLDLVLRFFPGLPGERLANFVWSRYGTSTGGIFAREPISRVAFMWPDDATRTYWNGRWWRHATDERGFRNPPGALHEVLLLGDSLVYGHGVEEDQTVAHFLRVDAGLGAYNMGRQGACLLDEYVFLRTFLAELAPRDVILTVFLNDFHDLEVARTATEIEQAPELDFDYPAIRAWAMELEQRRPGRFRRWRAGLPSLRLLKGLWRSLAAATIATPAWADEGPPLPDFLAPLESPDELARFAEYYQRLLADLASRLRKTGARLHVVYLSAGEWRRQWEAPYLRTLDLIRAAAAPSEVPVHDTQALFADCDTCFLAGDGHYSAAGHRRLARFLADEVLPAAD